MRRRSLWVALLAVASGLVTAAGLLPAIGASGAPPNRLTITPVSAPAPAITGGSALIRISGSHELRPSDVDIRVNGRAAKGFITDRTRPGSLIGNISGLRVGRNTVTARSDDASGQVVLTDRAADGPLFSGPKETPFICDTADFASVTGKPLGPPTDADCSAPTRVDYLYKATDGKLHLLADPSQLPTDVVDTTTLDGHTYPYILRLETGVIDRSIYEFAVLADPAQQTVDWRNPPARWNGKMVYNFGGGCPGGWYQQGRSTAGVTDDYVIGAGYAMVSSSLNVMGQNCNTLLSAEVASMTREHVIKEIGAPAYTLGWGCSGGSYQVNFIADEYPGLLDGILESCAFADIDFATLYTISDALLLNHYFKNAGKGEFTEEQQRAISGFGQAATIANLAGAGLRIDPRVYCPAQLPVDQRYDPQTNPDGARCDVYDHQRTIWDSRSGELQRPLDNQGVQYGLQALRDGVITAKQFLDLNRDIGGFDSDANIVPQRTVAPKASVDMAFRSDQMMQGHYLGDIPIIDDRGYTDDNPGGDIHLMFQSFTLRERLIKANGNADNEVLEVRKASSPQNAIDDLTALDHWLDAINADTAPGTHRERTIRNKPVEAVDACWTRDGSTKIVQKQVPGIGTTQCNTIYPVWTAPRQVAGAPLANDVVVCQREPVSPASAPGLSAAELASLRGIFPGGVCDWSRPDAGARPNQPWLSFGS